MIFKGYPREDGQVGTRNHIIVMSSVSCVNPVTEQIARATNTIPITHGYGCQQADEDSTETEWCLKRYAENPNVAGALVVGLTCEQIDAKKLAGEIEGKPTGAVNVTEEGTSAAITKGCRKIEEMKINASRLKREEAPLSKLVVHQRCSGFDTTSGIASNPAVGVASDLLIKEGAAVLIGGVAFGEHFLLRNVTDKQIVEELWRSTDLEAERYRHLPTVRGTNPTPGNIRQVLTTLTEKRLEGVMVGGRTSLKGVLTYKQKPPGSGLYYHAPGSGYIGCTAIVESTMGLLQGSQIFTFTTGTGTPLGLAIAPVVKTTGNPETFKRNSENMDINASTIIYGEETIEAVGKRIFNEIIEVANGKPTKSEIMGHRDFFLPIFAGALRQNGDLP